MGVVTVRKLMESGLHFGHQTKRWNPKMAPYIFTERNGVHIIDLQKTEKQVNKAYAFFASVVKTGKPILFVGTKKQARSVIETEAKRCDMFYVNHRWLGGMLTNYKTITQRIRRLRKIEEMAEDGTFEKLSKKEVLQLKREGDRLEKFLGGIKDMRGIPAALFIIDPKTENNAVKEAKKLGIPIVALADTNANPEEVDIPIPGNVDGVRGARLITSLMADAILEGKQGESFKDEDAPKADEDVKAEEVTEEASEADEETAETEE